MDKRCEPMLKQEHVRNMWANSEKICMAECLWKQYRTTNDYVARPAPASQKQISILPSHPLCLQKGCVNGCLTPNHKTDTCVLTRRNVNTSPRTHVLKTKENDTCIRCIENPGNRYMSSNLSKNSTKNPPTTCIEQTEMPDTCVLTNECAP